MRNVIMNDAISEYSVSDMTSQEDPSSSRVVEVNTTADRVTADGEPASAAEMVLANMPLAQVMRANAATVEALLVRMVDDDANPSDDTPPASREDAIEKVSEVVDRAIDADVVQPSFRRRISAIVDSVYKRHDPRVQLYADVAKKITAVMTEIRDDEMDLDPIIDDDIKKGEKGISDFDKGEGDLTFTPNAKGASTNMWIPGAGFMNTIPESADEMDVDPILPSEHGKEDIGKNIDETTLEFEGSNPTSEGGPSMSSSMYAPWMSSDSTDSISGGSESAKTIDPEDGASVSDKVADAATDPEDVKVENIENKAVADSMRMLAAAAINQRKFTAYVSRNLTSAILRRVGHDMRYCLPANFVQKYRL